MLPTPLQLTLLTAGEGTTVIIMGQVGRLRHRGGGTLAELGLTANSGTHAQTPSARGQDLPVSSSLQQSQANETLWGLLLGAQGNPRPRTGIFRTEPARSRRCGAQQCCRAGCRDLCSQLPHTPNLLSLQPLHFRDAISSSLVEPTGHLPWGPLPSQPGQASRVTLNGPGSPSQNMDWWEGVIRLSPSIRQSFPPP